MNPSLQLERAQRLLALHRAGDPVVLINAWDVISARIIESAGARAIATSSAAVAWVFGYPDGERISRDEMLGMVERIARAVSIPVTADLEAGYGSSPDDIAATVRLAIGVGAVGMNLEDAVPGAPAGRDDSVLSTEAAVERVAAARAAAGSAGLPFVLNARTDLYLLNIGDPATRLRRAVDRLNAYRAAGADSLFVPGVRDAETIAVLAREVEGPLNVLAGPGMPTVEELGRLGVARISVGSGAMRSALTAARNSATDLFETGSFAPMLDRALSFVEIDSLLRPAS